MAIYHINVTPLSRSNGRSATAAAAYRSATRIHDERSGELHDYRRKGGVEHMQIVLPRRAQEDGAQWALDRGQLWNAAERAEVRPDARVAREVEVALPHELTSEQRKRLAADYARHLAERYQCAVDIAIHAPHREGDERNYHAHLLLTTRVVEATQLGAKTAIEWPDRVRFKHGLESGRNEMKYLRQQWASLANEYLKAAGVESSVDHRSLADQGVERPPTKHLGPVVAERLRRGKDSYVAERIRQERLAEAQARLDAAAERGRLDREGRALERSIIDTESTLKTALATREAQREKPLEPGAQRAHAQELWLETRKEKAAPIPEADGHKTLILDTSVRR